MRISLAGRIAGQTVCGEIEAVTLAAGAAHTEKLARRNWRQGPVSVRWAAPDLAVVLLHDGVGAVAGYVTVDAQGKDAERRPACPAATSPGSGTPDVAHSAVQKRRRTTAGVA
jgi:hypothetical protein